MNDSYDKNKKYCKEYSENASKNLTDYYIKKRLKADGILNPSKELIELKRGLMKLQREIKK